MPKILWSQPLRGEDSLCQLNIFGVWTADRIKLTIWRRLRGLLETVVDNFHYLWTFYRPKNQLMKKIGSSGQLSCTFRLNAGDLFGALLIDSWFCKVLIDWTLFKMTKATNWNLNSVFDCNYKVPCGRFWHNIVSPLCKLMCPVSYLFI